MKGRETMAFDGLFTYAMTTAIQEQLERGRISKIYQPSKYEILLHIRAKGSNQKLLLSAHPSYSRIQLTNSTYSSPSIPPTFCMFLRKHLEGAVIEEISQVDMERIVEIKIRSRNEIGDEAMKVLVMEIMGRHSNIILLDEFGKILASLKHVSSSVNRHRVVAAGFQYVAPPAQNKVNPFDLEELDSLLDFTKGEIEKQLVEKIAGISPDFAKEVVFRGGNAGEISKVFFELLKQIKENQLTPQMISVGGKEHYYLIPLTYLQGETYDYISLSQLLDRFFFGKAERDRVKQQMNDLERFIANELAKNKKKDKKLLASLQVAENADSYQKLGELVTANIYAIKRGDKEIEVVDYYDENSSTITIPLNPMKSPSENAQAYFAKYQKAKSAIIHIQEQLLKNAEEIKYFENLFQQIENASQKDIDEIREELSEEGYLKLRKTTKQKKNTKPVIETYFATDGTEILVGKNNKQNEYITNKLAHRDEIWLHTKDIPGSHVVVRSKEPSEETLHEAANLASYFSKAKHSSSVPVDYTQIRHVKKPTGAKPGFVIYTNQQTLYVTPDEELIWKLVKK